MSPRALVVGVGNLLRQDDGLGVHLVRALRGRLPSDVEALEVGACALDVLCECGAFGRLVLVDAVAGGGQPGTVYRVPVADLYDRRPPPERAGEPGAPAQRLAREEAPAEGGMTPLSLHDLDLPVTLALAELAGARLDGAVLIGMEPAALGWGTELSPEVQARLPVLVEAVLAEVAGDPSGRVRGDAPRDPPTRKAREAAGSCSGEEP